MATFKIYKLHFTAPLHIGDPHDDLGISQKTLHSDTLYAALMSCLAKTGQTIPEDGDMGFTVSSLFPYYQKDEHSDATYFLPLPLYARQAKLADVSLRKKVKQVQWVDSALYAAVLSSQSFFADMDKYISYIQERYLSATPLPGDVDGSCEFVRSEASQRVTLKSRTGEEDAKPYYVDKILFRHHSGLYFIADGDTTQLDRALTILAMEGLGTDRNVGFGFFSFSKDTIHIDLPEKATHQMALSLFIPESSEQLTALMDSERVAYDFARRGGWVTTPPYLTIRKNAIYGFLPGSVFRKEPDSVCKPIGKLVNLKPDVADIAPSHPIWRCGRAIMLPINLN